MFTMGRTWISINSYFNRHSQILAVSSVDEIFDYFLLKKFYWFPQTFPTYVNITQTLKKILMKKVWSCMVHGKLTKIRNFISAICNLNQTSNVFFFNDIKMKFVSKFGLFQQFQRRRWFEKVRWHMTYDVTNTK